MRFNMLYNWGYKIMNNIKYKLIITLLLIAFLPCICYAANIDFSMNLLNSNKQETMHFYKDTEIIFLMEFVNFTDQEQVLYFNSSQHYDIAIYDALGVLVWNWANDKAFAQNFTQLYFDLLYGQIFIEYWNMVNNDGYSIGEGIYQAYLLSPCGGTLAGPYYIWVMQNRRNKNERRKRNTTSPY